MFTSSFGLEQPHIRSHIQWHPSHSPTLPTLWTKGKSLSVFTIPSIGRRSLLHLSWTKSFKESHAFTACQAGSHSWKPKFLSKNAISFTSLSLSLLVPMIFWYSDRFLNFSDSNRSTSSSRSRRLGVWRIHGNKLARNSFLLMWRIPWHRWKTRGVFLSRWNSSPWTPLSTCAAAVNGLGEGDPRGVQPRSRTAWTRSI